MGRYKGAIADYDEAICLNPHDPQAYLSRGIVRSELGVKDKAREDCHTALKLAQDANNEDLAARAEQAIENLDGDTLLNPSLTKERAIWGILPPFWPKSTRKLLILGRRSECSAIIV